MKTIRRREFFHISLLALVLFGAALARGAFGQENATNLSNYVILKLKDHTALEGPVLVEDDEQIIITSQFGSGTITRRDTIKKADIDTISRLTQGERAQHLAPWAYRGLDKYQLDPQNSYSLAYYDKVIDGAFKPFLLEYSGTVEAGTLTNRLADWQAERDKVASDQAKRHGRWMTTAEAEKLMQTEHAQQVLQRAKTFMSQGQYQAATDTLTPYYSALQPPEFAQETRRLQAEIYHLWISTLEARQQQLNKDLEVTKDRIARATEAHSQAQSTYAQARDSLNNQNTRVMGEDSLVNRTSSEMLRAQKELADAQTYQSSMQEELTYTVRTLTDARHDSDTFAASFPIIQLVRETPPPKTNAPPAPPPPPPSPPPPESVLHDITVWFGKNWIIVAGVGLLALWGISRLFTRT